MRARMPGPSVAGAMPRICSEPPLIGETAAPIRIVEDFPAPLGPRNPKDSPRLTSTLMPFTASTVPCLLTNDLRRSTARIIGSAASVTIPDLRRHLRQVAPDLSPVPWVPGCGCGWVRHTNWLLWRPTRMTLRRTSYALAAIATTSYDVNGNHSTVP